jgi:hypothetical protein
MRRRPLHGAAVALRHELRRTRGANGIRTRLQIGLFSVSGMHRRLHRASAGDLDSGYSLVCACSQLCLGTLDNLRERWAKLLNLAPDS